MKVLNNGFQGITTLAYGTIQILGFTTRPQVVSMNGNTISDNRIQYDRKNGVSGLGLTVSKLGSSGAHDAHGEWTMCSQERLRMSRLQGVAPSGRDSWPQNRLFC